MEVRLSFLEEAKVQISETRRWESFPIGGLITLAGCLLLFMVGSRQATAIVAQVSRCFGRTNVKGALNIFGQKIVFLAGDDDLAAVI